jgi:hypothetical protein
VIVAPHSHSETNLFEVIYAVYPQDASSRPVRPNRKPSCHDPNSRHDNEQVDEREAGAPLVGLKSFHSLTFSCAFYLSTPSAVPHFPLKGPDFVWVGAGFSRNLWRTSRTCEAK